MLVSPSSCSRLESWQAAAAAARRAITRASDPKSRSHCRGSGRVGSGRGGGGGARASWSMSAGVAVSGVRRLRGVQRFCSKRASAVTPILDGPCCRSVGQTTRTCAYDRAGLGASDPTRRPRRGREIKDLDTAARPCRDQAAVRAGRPFLRRASGSAVRASPSPTRRSAWCSSTPSAVTRGDATSPHGRSRSRPTCAAASSRTQSTTMSTADRRGARQRHPLTR